MKPKALLLSLLLFVSFGALAQKTKEDNEIYTAVEVQPEYPGGMAAFWKMMQKKFKYKEECNYRGSFYLQFVINKDRSVSDYKMIKGDAICLLELKKLFLKLNGNLLCKVESL